MKRTLTAAVCLFLLLILTSCWRSDDELKYDLCRVEVDTYLNIREEPNSRSKILGTVRKDSIITVLDDGNGWSRLYMDDKPVGYLSNDFLVLVKARKTEDDNGQPTEMHPMGNTGDDEEWAAMSESETGDNSPEALAAADSENDGPTFEKVRFIGQDSLLTADQKAIIESRLSQIDNFLFVVNTSSNVAAGELFDYAPDMLDALTADMDSQMGWWRRLKSWFGYELPSAKLVLLSYIVESGNGGLLQAECNGNALKYLKIKQPELYFDCQAEAMRAPGAGIASMGEAVADAGKEYSERNWFIRGQVNTGNIFEHICEDYISENILPRDSFLHKWVFGWIFAWPKSFAGWMVGLCGSFLSALVVMMLIILALKYFTSKAKHQLSTISEKRRFEGEGCVHTAIWMLLSLPRFFVWLSMLSMIIFMVPDMTKIFVMNMSGYGVEICKSALQFFANYSMPSNWILVVFFIVGTIIGVGMHEDLTLCATLPSQVQMRMCRNNEEKIQDLSTQYGLNADMEKLRTDETPYATLAMEVFMNKLEKTWPVLILAYIFSGTLLLYASIFMWTKALQKIIDVANGIRVLKSKGVYK